MVSIGTRSTSMPYTVRQAHTLTNVSLCIALIEYNIYRGLRNSFDKKIIGSEETFDRK